jgi:ATP-dependent Clp protease ATP-binding subunit ClpC
MRNAYFVAATLLLVQQGALAFSTGRLNRGVILPVKARSSSFTRPNVITCRRSPHHTGLSMVIERMSDECIGAIMTAHNIGNEIGLSKLRNEILFVGIVGKPERAAVTLEKYNIQYQEVKETAIAQVRRSVSDLVEGGNEKREALPFSAACKVLLEQALDIANGLNSRSVRSEHVLLALMGYNKGRPFESAPALDVLDNMPGLKGLEGKDFSCFAFCQDLVQDLESQPGTDIDTGSAGPTSRQEVPINRGGTGLGSSTLASLGVDLTQMALEGKLDNVYGRDNEIRSALRTLGRRRKNNPCLIGGEVQIGENYV